MSFNHSVGSRQSTVVSRQSGGNESEGIIYHSPFTIYHFFTILNILSNPLHKSRNRR